MPDTNIPTIDLSAARNGPPQAREEAARAIGRACEDIGFFLVSGHGIEEGLIGGVYQAARSFFDLPVDEKMKVKRRKAEISRGYNVFADQSLAYSRGMAMPPDLQESINFGPMAIGSGPYYDEGFGAVHFAPNLWPENPAALRPLTNAYYHAMEGLAAELMALFAVSLALPADFFADKIDRHVSSLRFINYPDHTVPPAPGQLRAGEHSDYGSLTILKVEDAPGGLQVQDRAGRWLDIGHVPGTFVVNIGDLMMQWTNDRWISTLHRVANPPPIVGQGARRISLVFFHQPNYDAEIACLPTCQDSANQPRHPVTTSGAHWRAKNQAAREMKASLLAGAAQ